MDIISMHNQVTTEFGGFIIISACADDVIRWWPPAHTGPVSGQV